MGKPIFPRNIYGNLYGGAFLVSAAPPVPIEALIQAAAAAVSKSSSVICVPKPAKKKKKKSKADKVVDESTIDKMSGF